MAASIAGNTSSPVRNHWQAVWVAVEDMPQRLFCAGGNGNDGEFAGEDCRRIAKVSDQGTCTGRPPRRRIRRHPPPGSAINHPQ